MFLWRLRVFAGKVRQTGKVRQMMHGVLGQAARVEFRMLNKGAISYRLMCVSLPCVVFRRGAHRRCCAEIWGSGLVYQCGDWSWIPHVGIDITSTWFTGRRGVVWRRRYSPHHALAVWHPFRSTRTRARCVQQYVSYTHKMVKIVALMLRRARALPTRVVNEMAPTARQNEKKKKKEKTKEIVRRRQRARRRVRRGGRRVAQNAAHVYFGC